MMSILRAVGKDELVDVTDALRALGATAITINVLGSVGHEYAYAVSYEAEGDSADDWMFTMPPRVVEIPVIDDSTDDTLADTKELDYGFINRKDAA